MSEKILFVDDEPNLLKGLARQLYRKYDVVTAHGPEAGLAALREQGPFAIVVTDMRMPGMDGVAFLDQARMEAPDAILMVLSGQSTEEQTVAAGREGVFRFLIKPCSPVELTRALDDAIVAYRTRPPVEAPSATG